MDRLGPSAGQGFLTGGTQAAITYPTEYVKTQLQLQSILGKQHGFGTRRYPKKGGVTGMTPPEGKWHLLETDVHHGMLDLFSDRS